MISAGSAYPLARVAPNAHPAAVLRLVFTRPAHLHVAEHALGVRHHGREAAVGRGHRRQAACAAVGVEGVLLRRAPVVVHVAHGGNGLVGVAPVLEVGITLAMRHGSRLPAMPCRNRLGDSSTSTSERRASKRSLWLVVKRGQSCAPGMMSASSANI